MGAEPQAQPSNVANKPADLAQRYCMHQQLVSIGNDYWIENEQGVQVYRVDGKALRLRRTLIFQDRNGQELCQLQARLFAIRKTMQIEGPDGRVLATVQKAMLKFVREHFTLSIPDQPEIEIQGDVLDHEYRFERQGIEIARTSKTWFRVADSYGVEIQPGQNDVLILAATVAVDMLGHPAR